MRTKCGFIWIVLFILTYGAWEYNNQKNIVRATEIPAETKICGYYVAIYTTDKHLYSDFFKDREEATKYFKLVKDSVGIDAIQLAVWDILWEDETITMVNPEFVGVPPKKK